jgi:hypothetical protein
MRKRFFSECTLGSSCMEIQWHAQIHGVDVYHFFHILMLDLPWRYGKVVGKSVLESETYDFLPGRMEIQWFVRKNTDHRYHAQLAKLLLPFVSYGKESDHDLLVATLKVSAYVSGGVHIAA